MAERGHTGELAWVENDLTAAFAKAKAEGKTVLVDFTGYACTNCHWMKANMFTKPEIAGVMKNMVLVDLYTDGTDAASQANQKLEEEKFQTIADSFLCSLRCKSERGRDVPRPDAQIRQSTWHP